MRLVGKSGIGFTRILAAISTRPLAGSTGGPTMSAAPPRPRGQEGTSLVSWFRPYETGGFLLLGVWQGTRQGHVRRGLGRVGVVGWRRTKLDQIGYHRSNVRLTACIPVVFRGALMIFGIDILGRPTMFAPMRSGQRTVRRWRENQRQPATLTDVQWTTSSQSWGRARGRETRGRAGYLDATKR